MQVQAHKSFPREHRYATTVEWTGNLGEGTETYAAFSRDHAISGDGKPPIPGSSG